jgi:pimeloyl-ACP methyl ester carboxylesterase
MALGLRGVKKLRIPPLPTTEKAPSQELWFEQPLDHFDPLNTQSWQQRYWTNLDNYVEGGPAMIFIEGEGEANPTWLTYGHWYYLAREQGAAMFLLEHRYYGASHPTADMVGDNMRYLSSRQALEDLGKFISSMNVDYNLTGPWISFGGSYPGSLSAWLRLKFPHLLTGAVSSSGPLNAKLDYFEYLDVVADALATTGPGCTDVIGAALEAAEQLLATGESGWAELSTMFLTCKNLDGTNKADVASFIELLVDNLAGIVQYNGLLSMDIGDVCDIMRDEELGTPLERFAVLNAESLESNGEECLDHEYASFLALLTETSWSGGGIGWRQWIWQTCTEFGWYQTSNQPSGVFGSLLTLEFFESWCQDAFGPEFSHERMETLMVATNDEYGGFFPDVDNVVFVHGSIDPWHAMGVLENLSETAPAIYINGTSHCADMYPSYPDDPEELLQARAKITELVDTWIKNARK